MIAIYVRESTPRQYEKGFNFETQKEKSLQFLDLYDLLRKRKECMDNKPTGFKRVNAGYS